MIQAMPERKVFLFIDVFPKINCQVDKHHHIYNQTHLDNHNVHCHNDHHHHLDNHIIYNARLQLIMLNSSRTWPHTSVWAGEGACFFGAKNHLCIN